MNRDIFYIAGYDPRSYRFYYKTYKENLEKYNKLTKQNIRISSIKSDEKYKYFDIQNLNLNAKYVFLEWQEIIKLNWSKSSFKIFNDYLYVFLNFLLNLKFLRFYKIYKISLITGFYPFLSISLFYILVFLCGYFLYKNINNIYLFLFCFFVFIYFFNKLFLFVGKKSAIFWLLNIFVFSSKLANNKIKNIDNIVDDFSDILLKNIKNYQNDEKYELILISHSVGTIINILVLYKLILKCEELQINYKNLKVITLGECIPLCSLVNKHSNFVKCLEFLSSKNIFWVDFTSKIDGACFYLTDFFKASGLKTNENILYLSSAFYKLYDKLYYKKIMRKWYKVHFMYLFATHYLGRYDFFAFSTNDKFLEEQIKDTNENMSVSSKTE